MQNTVSWPKETFMSCKCSHNSIKC